MSSAIRPLHSAKIELSSIFNDFFSSVFEKNAADEPFISWRVEGKSLRFIQKIKSTIKNHNINYVSVSSLIFSILEKRLKENIKLLSNISDNKESTGYMLFALIEITFFIYAMDVRVSSTYKVTRICIEAMKAIENMPADIVDKIKKKIHDESMLIFDIEINKQPNLYMEIINLLAVCKLLGDKYRLPSKKIDNLIDVIKESHVDKIDYFLVVSILFYIGDDVFFISQKTELEKILLDRFTTVKSPFNRTDFTCLFFDLLSCPFLTVAFKNKIVLVVKIEEKGNYRKLSDKERTSVKNEIYNHQWFTDWKARDDIAVLLEKKKFITPY